MLLTISLKNVSFTSQNKLRNLSIPASKLRHALINGVFSVLFKKRCQSVLCVISESFLFVCLFVLIYNVSQKILKVHFWQRFSRVVFRTGSTMELVVCRSLLQRPKTDSFCKYKIRFPWIPYIAEELLLSSAVFLITLILLT